MARNGGTDKSSDGQSAGRLLTPKEAGLLLGLAPQTLAHYRCRGCGPAYKLLSKRCVRYDLRAIETWLSARGRESTAENGEG